jgi:hypothetical protein
VILCKNPKIFIGQTDWIAEFGLVKNKAIEDWGKVTSMRVWYEEGLEVEFGLTAQDWIAQPLDEGTRKVLKDGYKILVDKAGRLRDLGTLE